MDVTEYAKTLINIVKGLKRDHGEAKPGCVNLVFKGSKSKVSERMRLSKIPGFGAAKGCKLSTNDVTRLIHHLVMIEVLSEYTVSSRNSLYPSHSSYYEPGKQSNSVLFGQRRVKMSFRGKGGSKSKKGKVPVKGRHICTLVSTCECLDVRVCVCARVRIRVCKYVVARL